MIDILVLGAGRAQNGLIKTAKDMGYHVTVASMLGDNPPFSAHLADDIIEVDISDSDKTLEKVLLTQKIKEKNFSGVVTSCMDTSLVSLGNLCDYLELPGISKKSALNCKNKIDMKRAFVANEVRTAKYCIIRSEADIEKALKILPLPVVFKAVDLQGSSGVYICKNISDLKRAFYQARELSKVGEYIVEEFLYGTEFGAQAFILNGKVLFILLHGDELTITDNTSVPIGHYVPLDVSERIYSAAVQEIEKAINALELDNCAINVDLMLSKDEVYIIEASGRVGANCLPEIVGSYFGINYYELILRAAADDNAMEFWQNRSQERTAVYSRMIFKSSKGVEKVISLKREGIPEFVPHLNWFIVPGQKVKKLESSSDCLGEILVTGKDYNECRKRMRKCLEILEPEYEKNE